LPGFGHFLLRQADIFYSAKVGARDLGKLIAAFPAVPGDFAPFLRGVIFVGEAALCPGLRFPARRPARGRRQRSDRHAPSSRDRRPSADDLQPLLAGIV
jgi:hypothetical protein